ncbi:MAG: GNAT family N-acetyltransferase [Pseudomonadota bacterium]
MVDHIIREANKGDLLELHDWLQREYREINEGFFSNWNLIEEAFDVGELVVLVVEGQSVAFLVDGRYGPDIVEVRPDLRGRGFGQIIAEEAIRRAYKRDLSVIKIACAPITSVPFWRKMGFTTVAGRDGRGGGDFAYKILEKDLVQQNGIRGLFSISLFPEERGYNTNTKPHFTVQGVGSVAGSVLHLPSRVALFEARTQHSDDMVVRVEINGSCLFEDKLKRPAAAEIGVLSDVGYNYFIDFINIK